MSEMTIEERLAQLEKRHLKGAEWADLEILNLQLRVEALEDTVKTLTRHVVDSLHVKEMAERSFLRTHPQVLDDMDKIDEVLGLTPRQQPESPPQS